MNMKFKYPELAVPFQEKPLRDRAYKYVLSVAIAAMVVLVIILLNMKGAC